MHLVDLVRRRFGERHSRRARRPSLHRRTPIRAAAAAARLACRHESHRAGRAHRGHQAVPERVRRAAPDGGLPHDRDQPGRPAGEADPADQARHDGAANESSRPAEPSRTPGRSRGRPGTLRHHESRSHRTGSIRVTQRPHVDTCDSYVRRVREGPDALAGASAVRARRLFLNVELKHTRALDQCVLSPTVGHAHTAQTGRGPGGAALRPQRARSWRCCPSLVGGIPPARWITPMV